MKTKNIMENIILAIVMLPIIYVIIIESPITVLSFIVMFFHPILAVAIFIFGVMYKCINGC